MYLRLGSHIKVSIKWCHLVERFIIKGLFYLEACMGFGIWKERESVRAVAFALALALVLNTDHANGQ